jgi:hypothetical protein
MNSEAKEILKEKIAAAAEGREPILPEREEKPEKVKRRLTEKELLAADIDDLTTDELQRRLTVVSLRTQMMAMQKTQQEVHDWEIRQRDKLVQQAAKIQSVKDQMAKIEADQRACRHLTGGTGAAGWTNGDGLIYGASTSPQELPTGERYFLCWRCAKEFRLPSKRAVINGEMTYAEYLRQEQEYYEQARAKRKSMEGTDGAAFAGIGPRFRVPSLEKQRVIDDQDFEVYKNQHPELVQQTMRQ